MPWEFGFNAPADSGRLEQVAHAEQAREVVKRKAGGGHSPRWEGLYEALGFEHLERAPNRSPADAKVRRELVLHEFGSLWAGGR